LLRRAAHCNPRFDDTGAARAGQTIDHSFDSHSSFIQVRSLSGDPRKMLVATSILLELPSARQTSMPTLLHIDSSPRRASVSCKLSSAFVEKWRREHPGGTIVHRNTTLEKIPYLDEAAAESWFTPISMLTPSQKQTLTYSDTLVDELLAADVLVLGVPMWNLGIPASLKAWIDMIVREGRTFAFTDSGVKPLVPAGKQVYVFSARGGAYPEGSPFAALDQLELYLRAIFACIGLTGITFIYADNQSGSAASAAEGLIKAEHELAQLFA
jgi:FMN-dependent NADH-azoreductase